MPSYGSILVQVYVNRKIIKRLIIILLSVVLFLGLLILLIISTLFGSGLGKKVSDSKTYVVDPSTLELKPILQELLGFPYVFPTIGVVTQTYNPFSGAITGYAHRAWDIAGGLNQPIYAFADGTVDSITASGDCGNGIGILHSDNVRTLYCHMNSAPNNNGVLYKLGDKVSMDSVIGYQGNTGATSKDKDGIGGVHLHFEIQIKINDSFVGIDLSQVYSQRLFSHIAERELRLNSK